jgi:hypothetical protein
MYVKTTTERNEEKLFTFCDSDHMILPSGQHFEMCIMNCKVTKLAIESDPGESTTAQTRNRPVGIQSGTPQRAISK